MSKPLDYSKWDQLVISDESDNESNDSVQMAMRQSYIQQFKPSSSMLQHSRFQQLLTNNIIPFDQKFDFDYDSLDDSDIEYSNQSNKPFNNMQFEAFAKMRLQNNFKDKMKIYEENKIIRTLEVERLNAVHKDQIKSNNKLLQSDYILYIYLQGIKPRIWRKIRVPARISLAAFHDKILTPLFSWKRNFHSYLFLEQKRKNKMISYGPTNTHSADMMHIGTEGHYWYKLGSIIVDSQIVYLCDVLNEDVNQLRYVYDLGDDYFHKIILEKILPMDRKTSIVEIIGGQKGYPLENTKGNEGFVERLNKLNDVTVSQDQFENAASDFINSPNFGPKHGGLKYPYNINVFHMKYVQKRIKRFFRKKLTRQDALSMMRYPYGKYSCQGIEKSKQYKKGQDVQDSKEWLEKHRGARRCSACGNYDKKYSGSPREKIYKCCKGCLNVFYCSRKCQKKDWNCNHRYYCFDHSRF
eukprot:328084_1